MSPCRTSPARPGCHPGALVRALGGLLLTAGLGGGLLSACGGSADALGQQACREVTKALRLYHQAGQAPSPAAASRERARSLTDLRQALQDAARAGSSGGSWQALAATLSESNRVPEQDLVPALRAQCAPSTPAGG